MTNYKLVPVEPDWNMQMAGIKELLSCTTGELKCIGEKLLDGYICEVNAIFQAMLDAAPQPAGEPEINATIQLSGECPSCHHQGHLDEFVFDPHGKIVAQPAAPAEQELIDFPELSAGIVRHGQLGELYDRLQVQQYAMRYAMLYTHSAPCKRCEELEQQLSTAKGLLVEGRYLELFEEYTAMEAKLAALEARNADQAKDMLRLIESVKYMRGIAERGIGVKCPEHITVEKFVLNYVKNLEAKLQRAEKVIELLNGNLRHSQDCNWQSLKPCNCGVSRAEAAIAEYRKEVK